MADEGSQQQTVPDEPSVRSHPLHFVPTRLAELGSAERRLLLFYACFVVCVGVLLFAPLYDRGFSDFDDHTWLRDAAQRNTLGTIFDPLLRTGHEAMDTSYVPIQSLLYHLSINVLGLGATPIRLLGLGLHVLNACLVLLLAFRFTRSPPASLLASLAFLVFPHNVHTIAWLCASLAHGLVWFLYLAAFLLLQSFLHWRAWCRLAGAVALFVAAVLTKELSTTLLGAAVLYDVLVVSGVRSLWPPKRAVYLGLCARHGPLLAVVVCAVVIQLLKYETGFVHTKFGGTSFGLRNPLRLTELLTLLLHWGAPRPHQTVLLAMGAVAAAFFTGLYLTRRQPPLLFLLLWLPLVMIPFTISNFRDVHSLGRYVYEASAVCAVLLAAAATGLARTYPRCRWPALAAAALLVIYFAVRARGVLP